MAFTNIYFSLFEPEYGKIKGDKLYSSDIYFYYKAVMLTFLGAYEDREGKGKCQQCKKNKDDVSKGLPGGGAFITCGAKSRNINHHKQVYVFEIVSSCIG